jgi:CMP-N-acetylneuraminate monooxygenase
MKIKVSSLTEGVNFVEDFIVYREGSQILRVIRNECRHMGGKFGGCAEKDSVVCRRHNWKLNAKTLEYSSPVGVKHPSIRWRVENDYIRIEEEEYDQSCRSTIKALTPNEFKIKFYSHACIEVLWNGSSFFTDPWLIGPAFTKGWWLVHSPPSNWLERLAASDGIYFSHNHSDHMNVHTLRMLVGENPNVPIYIPNFESTSCYTILSALGFKNINSVDFESKQTIKGLSFTIFEDTTGRDDSGILFDYKGHKILNTVDCKNIKSKNIENVKVLLKEFSSGASGFPVCWLDQYSLSKVKGIVKGNREHIKKNLLESISHFKPQIFVPFAGYFSENYPTDSDIKDLNQKNDPHKIADLVEEKVSGVQAWVPEPGKELDLYDFSTKHYEGDYYLDESLEHYASMYKQGPHVSAFDTMYAYEAYFRGIGFKGDLILHVVETDEEYQEILNEFFVDFSTTPKVSKNDPIREGSYLKMKVRQSTFRYVLFHGLPWEEFSIGFQARFSRTPDSYNFAFWDHMQNYTFQGGVS